MHLHNKDRGRKGIDDQQSDLIGGALYSRQGTELSFFCGFIVVKKKEGTK